MLVFQKQPFSGRTHTPYGYSHNWNAMLLNEFLKEHRRVERQDAAIAALKSELQMVRAEQRKNIQTLPARLEQQAAQIQKVSAHVAAANPSRPVADLR